MSSSSLHMFSDDEECVEHVDSAIGTFNDSSNIENESCIDRSANQSDKSFPTKTSTPNTKFNSPISVPFNTLSGGNEIDDSKCIVLRSGRKGT